MKFETIRTALIAIIILLAGIWAYQSFSGSSETATSQSLKFNNHEEVKAFMRAETAKKLPDDYVVPGYILSEDSIQLVYDEFGKRFPEFYGFGSTQLIDSVMMNPERYILMLNDNKAIRNKFDASRKY